MSASNLTRLAPRARSLLALFLGIDEPDRAFGRIGRRHELVDRLNELPELNAGVAAEAVMRQRQPLVLLRQLAQPLGQVGMQAGQLAQMYENPHECPHESPRRRWHRSSSTATARAKSSKATIWWGAAHAIDRKIIAKALLGDFADPTLQLQGKGFLGHDDAPQARYPIDIPKARTLLAAAGYPDGFELKLSYMSNTLSSVMSQVLAGQLKEAGIRVKLNKPQRFGAMDAAAAAKRIEALVSVTPAWRWPPNCGSTRPPTWARRATRRCAEPRLLQLHRRLGRPPQRRRPVV